MDGDNSAKSMEQGANSAMKAGVNDMTEGVHESVNQTVRSRPSSYLHNNVFPLACTTRLPLLLRWHFYASHELLRGKG